MSNTKKQQVKENKALIRIKAALHQVITMSVFEWQVDSTSGQALEGLVVSTMMMATERQCNSFGLLRSQKQWSVVCESQNGQDGAFGGSCCSFDSSHVALDETVSVSERFQKAKGLSLVSECLSWVSTKIPGWTSKFPSKDQLCKEPWNRYILTCAGRGALGLPLMSYGW